MLNRFGQGEDWKVPYERIRGKPCTRPHPTKKTPVRNLPTRVAKRRCDCVFPEGPKHASFNPKTNLVENTFAKIDRQMMKNKRADAINNRVWPKKGSEKPDFWKAELVKTIKMVDADKKWFRNQYRGFKDRCRAYVQSNGKRLRRSRW